MEVCLKESNNHSNTKANYSAVTDLECQRNRLEKTAPHFLSLFILLLSLFLLCASPFADIFKLPCPLIHHLSKMPLPFLPPVSPLPSHSFLFISLFFSSHLSHSHAHSHYSLFLSFLYTPAWFEYQAASAFHFRQDKRSSTPPPPSESLKALYLEKPFRIA